MTLLDSQCFFSKKVLADVTIEILSRPISTRELVIIGSKGK